MKLTLTEEKFEFDFPAAKALFKFDERDRLSPNFHGVPMQAVDVIAEFNEYQIWIEIKEFMPEEIDEMRKEGNQIKKNTVRSLKANLTKNFKHKFRDTYLYRLCEDKLDLPIKYICLTNFDNELNLFYKKELIKQLPTGLANKKRWHRFLIDKSNVMVLNPDVWIRNFDSLLGTCKKIK